MGVEAAPLGSSHARRREAFAKDLTVGHKLELDGTFEDAGSAGDPDGALDRLIPRGRRDRDVRLARRRGRRRLSRRRGRGGRQRLGSCRRRLSGGRPCRSRRRGGWRSRGRRRRRRWFTRRQRKSHGDHQGRPEGRHRGSAQHRRRAIHQHETRLTTSTLDVAGGYGATVLAWHDDALDVAEHPGQAKLDAVGHLVQTDRRDSAITVPDDPGVDLDTLAASQGREHAAVDLRASSPSGVRVSLEPSPERSGEAPTGALYPHQYTTTRRRIARQEEG